MTAQQKQFEDKNKNSAATVTTTTTPTAPVSAPPQANNSEIVSNINKWPASLKTFCAKVYQHFQSSLVLAEDQVTKYLQQRITDAFKLKSDLETGWECESMPSVEAIRKVAPLSNAQQQQLKHQAQLNIKKMNAARAAIQFKKQAQEINCFTPTKKPASTEGDVDEVPPKEKRVKKSRSSSSSSSSSPSRSSSSSSSSDKSGLAVSNNKANNKRKLVPVEVSSAASPQVSAQTVTHKLNGFGFANGGVKMTKKQRKNQAKLGKRLQQQQQQQQRFLSATNNNDKILLSRKSFQPTAQAYTKVYKSRASFKSTLEMAHVSWFWIIAWSSGFIKTIKVNVPQTDK